MEYHIIIVLTIVVGLFQLYPSNNRFALAILWLLIIARSHIFLQIEMAHVIGLILWLISLILIIVYGFAIEKSRSKERNLIVLSALLVLVKTVFYAQHWPAAKLCALFMVLPISFYLYLVFGKRKLSGNEFGFMTVITGDAVVAFIRWVGI